MHIYIFAEHYPNYFKPYLDTQFVQFLRDKYEVSIFAFGKWDRVTSEVVERHRLQRRTHYLPNTLKTLPRFFASIIVSVLKNPVQRIRSICQILDPSVHWKRNLMNVARMLLLPLAEPPLCLVHNLATATYLSFLRRFYPRSRCVLYYHGGEIPGTPNFSDGEATRAVELFHVVFTNTEYSKKELVTRSHPATKVVISPVGFSVSDFQPGLTKVYRPHDVLRLISVGRLAEEKGLVYGLQAVRHCIVKGYGRIQYRIIGDGPLHQELEGYVRESGLSSHVELCGPAPSEAVIAELEKADVLLLPSIPTATWEESQACVVQEAMLMKLLVVTAATGGVPESISPEMTRFAVPPRNPGAIADRLIEIMHLPDIEIRELGLAARRFAESRYDIRLLNAQLLQESLGDGS